MSVGEIAFGGISTHQNEEFKMDNNFQGLKAMVIDDSKTIRRNRPKPC